MQRILLAAIAMLMAAAVSAPCSLAAPGNRWGEKYFPNVPVVTQDGKTLRFYDDLIRDKIVVVSFIYTTCADLCPVTTARLSTLQARLGDAMGIRSSSEAACRGAHGGSRRCHAGEFTNDR